MDDKKLVATTVNSRTVGIKRRSEGMTTSSHGETKKMKRDDGKRRGQTETFSTLFASSPRLCAADSISFGFCALTADSASCLILLSSSIYRSSNMFASSDLILSSS